MPEHLQTVGEKAEIFIKARKDIGLEVNSEKTKYVITSSEQNAVQNQLIIIINFTFVNVEKYRYLIQTTFARKLNAELTWEMHVTIHLSSRLLSTTSKVNMACL